MNFNIDKAMFDSKGFVLIKNFFSDGEATNIVQYADELEQWEETPQKWMIYFEKNKTQKKKSRIENFINYHNGIKKIFDTKIIQFINKIYGKQMLLFKEKLNWKIGGAKGFKAHQDHPAWDDFEPNRYVTAAVFANNSTVENGCLEIAETHNKINKILEQNLSGELKSEIENKFNWNAYESTPRDLLLFDSFVLHRSQENKTSNSRRIFYFTLNEEKYGDIYETYLKQKRIEFPPDIERTHSNIKIKGNKYNLANPIE